MFAHEMDLKLGELLVVLPLSLCSIFHAIISCRQDKFWVESFVGKLVCLLYHLGSCLVTGWRRWSFQIPYPQSLPIIHIHVHIHICIYVCVCVCVCMCVFQHFVKCRLLLQKSRQLQKSSPQMLQSSLIDTDTSTKPIASDLSIDDSTDPGQQGSRELS